MDFKVVGRPIGRVEGPEKVGGKTVYTADVQLPGMLWGKCLRSPYAHARIVRINLDKAQQVKGAMLILTGTDVPAHRVGLSLQTRRFWRKAKYALWEKKWPQQRQRIATRPKKRSR